MYKTIVIGCDGAGPSRDAITLAERLRDPRHGSLVLVSVFEENRAFALPPSYTDWHREKAEVDLRWAEGWVGPGVPFERQTMAAASAAAGLDEIAERVGADLIVLGSSHHGAAGRLTGRTTVQRMLHGAPCALAVARRGQDRLLAGGGTITVAYDDSPEARFALATAYEIAAFTGSRIRIAAALEHVVYSSGYGGPVNDPTFDLDRSDRARRRLAALRDEAPEGLEVETRTTWGAPAAAVLDMAAHDTELIVAGSRGYGPVRRVLAGSVSADLLVHSPVPVLVTPRIVARAAETRSTVATGAAGAGSPRS